VAGGRHDAGAHPRARRGRLDEGEVQHELAVGVVDQDQVAVRALRGRLVEVDLDLLRLAGGLVSLTWRSCTTAGRESAVVHSPDMSRVVGIDLGSRRIGVALSDGLGLTPSRSPPSRATGACGTPGHRRRSWRRTTPAGGAGVAPGSRGNEGRRPERPRLRRPAAGGAAGAGGDDRRELQHRRGRGGAAGGRPVAGAPQAGGRSPGRGRDPAALAGSEGAAAR
jgi:hypothetical protein